MRTLQVGIIGVNAEHGWAAEGHVPAVRATEGLELAAVATRRQDSADAAAAAFGVPSAYGDPLQLINDPNIDIVTVASSVSTHQDLLEAALRRGRHVVTEWPVAVGTEAMTKIADDAAAAGVRSAVGLQARRNPAVLRAGTLLADGRIGRVLVARVFSTTAAFGPEVDTTTTPLEDPSAGMHLLTIQAAHTLDIAAALLGAPSSIAALTTVRFPELRRNDGATVRRTLPDHVAIHGVLHDGGVFMAEIAGGRAVDDCPFHLVIEGTDGILELSGGSPRGFQAGILTLTVNGEVQEPEVPALPEPVVNVAGVYRALLDDIRIGTNTAPSFDDAVRLAHLLDDLRSTSASGTATSASSEWPRHL